MTDQLKLINEYCMQNFPNCIQPPKIIFQVAQQITFNCRNSLNYKLKKIFTFKIEEIRELENLFYQQSLIV